MADVKRTTPDDAFVGQRVRTIRLLRTWSQERLAEALGITFQQIQKYEKGSNRIGAGRLYRISVLMDVPINYFFEDIDVGKRKHSEENPSVTAISDDKMALQVAMLFMQISDPTTRTHVKALVRSAARVSPAEE